MTGGFYDSSCSKLKFSKIIRDTKDAEKMLDQITSLKAASLTSRTVLHVFLQRRILPLKVRPAPMWVYIGPGNQSAEADELLPDEFVDALAWIVLGSASGEPAVSGGPPPFSVFEPRRDDLPFRGSSPFPRAREAGMRGWCPPILLQHRALRPQARPWGRRRPPRLVGSGPIWARLDRERRRGRGALL